MHKLFDYFFWFTQPATILTPEDKMLFYITVGLIGIAIIFRILVSLMKNIVTKELLRKYWNLTLTIGLSGLVWFAMRYENTPIFAQRYWMGLNLLIGIIWLLFVLKFTIFDYPKKNKEYEREIVKNKYIQKSR